MGDIAFNIFKDVNLNKVVTLDIDKDVNVNVDNPDLLATAEADAEAFGPNALAEVDAYTLVSGGATNVIPNPGSVNANGNTLDLILGADNDTDLVPDTITIDFTSDGPVPDLDDLTGFGSLESLNSSLPPLPDFPIPGSFLSSDLNLSQTGVVSPNPAPGVDFEAQYRVEQTVIANFGERELDLDGDTQTATDDLLLTIPEGTLFLAQFLDDGQVNVEFEAFDTVDGFFTFDGINYDVSAFDFEAASIQGPPDEGNWNFLAESNFGSIEEGNGQAFAYAESTSALDLNPVVGPIDPNPLPTPEPVVI